jgi:hypothetical protein
MAFTILVLAHHDSVKIGTYKHHQIPSDGK